MRLMIALLLELGCCSPALGEIYKWKDEKGVTHYGERPEGKDAQTVNRKPGSQPSVSEDAEKDGKDAVGGRPRKPRRAAAETSQQRQEREFQERQRGRQRDEDADLQRRAELTRQEAKRRQDACSDARRNLTYVKSTSEGQRGYRLQEIRSLEEQISRNC